jgi:hypothetical protein
MNAAKLLMTLGTAIATSKVARAATDVELEDVLGLVGLTRRRSYLLENIALIGTGALIGAGAALLFAPASGHETRQRLSKEVDKLGEKAADAIREVREGAPELMARVGNVGNGGSKGEQASTTTRMP